MKKLVLCATVALLALSASAHAAFVGVAGPNSSAGTAASLISSPTFAQNSIRFNTGQEGFNEAQNVLLGAALDTDAGVGAIAAGTRVDSHMIFLNKADNVSGSLSHFGVTWTFDGVILGVMSDQQGALEAASTGVLGAAGTTYEAPFNARGMEGADAIGLGPGDGYFVSGNTIRVGMFVTQPGDWIRVVTQHVPEPTSMALFGLGALGLGVVRRRRKA